MFALMQLAAARLMRSEFFESAVELFDAAGLAGTGQHTRAIVKTERLLEDAKKRAAR